MRAAQIVEFGSPLVVNEVRSPSPGPDEAIVEVAACGICRSDWHIWKGHWGWVGVAIDLPRTPGHEIAGVVAEVGSVVTRFKRGDRVIVPFHLACGRCQRCLAGITNLCENVKYLGGGVDGGFGELLHVPGADRNMVALPDAIELDAASLLGCRYMTAYHAITRGALVEAGEWAVVVGVGGAGISAVQLLAALGAMPIAVDVDPRRLEMATAEGAVLCLNSRTDDVVAAVQDATHGGAHVSLDTVVTEGTTETALRSLRVRGRHVQIGMTTDRERGLVPLPTDLIVSRELRISGTSGNPHHRYEPLLNLVASGRCRPERLIDSRIPLSAAGGAMSRMDAYAAKGFQVITDFRN